LSESDNIPKMENFVKTLDKHENMGYKL